jgi:DNA-directed RNA polymerase-3 subunit RPC5
MAETETEAQLDADNNDHDPIVSEFEVFIKPHLNGDRQIFVFQFPNRDRSKPYDARHACAPTELRVKPKAGMVELDVPLDVYRNYDRKRGIKWGESMKRSSVARGGGSHGLPGGFGIGGAPSVGRGRGRGEVEEVDQGKLLENYQNAVEDGHVLQKQTLGGQFIAKNSTSPQYMLGTFTNGIDVLLPVSSQTLNLPFRSTSSDTRGSNRSPSPSIPPYRCGRGTRAP